MPLPSDVSIAEAAADQSAAFIARSDRRRRDLEVVFRVTWILSFSAMGLGWLTGSGFPRSLQWINVIDVCAMPDGTHVVKAHSDANQSIGSVLVHLYVGAGAFPFRIGEDGTVGERINSSTPGFNIAAERDRIAEYLLSCQPRSHGFGKAQEQAAFRGLVERYRSGTLGMWHRPTFPGAWEIGWSVWLVSVFAYAALKFLLWTRFDLYKGRGFARLKRGQCPHCGYPGVPRYCPECATDARGWEEQVPLSVLQRVKRARARRGTSPPA